MAWQCGQMYRADINCNLIRAIHLAPLAGFPIFWEVFVSNIGVGGRECDNRLLHQPIKQHTARSGCSSIESEDKFIEVAIHVFGVNGTVMGSEQPTFEQGSDTMDAGQGLMCWRL